MPSENGWEPAKAGPDQCQWVTIPGTDVTLQLLKGWPLIVMRAVAADFNAYIEPLRDPDSAAWTPTNAVATSNHLNATAMDLNWVSHPFRVRGTFSTSQMATIRELLAFYEGTIFWAGDWREPIDEMHWQMGYSTYNNPDVPDFIARKIRADGFSTFRRGPLPPSKTDQYALAVINEGRRRRVSAKGICIALTVPFVETGWKIYANANVPASLDYPHDAVGSDHDSTGLFQQRQAWGPLSCTMDPHCSAGLFYDGGKSGQPGLLDQDFDADWQSPGMYAADVQQPNAKYRYRYDQRWDEAVALYNRLANIAPPPPPPPPPPGDDMALVPQDQWDNLYRAVMANRDSRSPLRRLGEHNVGDTPDQVWDIDGSVHLLVVEMLARHGSPDDLALLQEVAAADPQQFPDRQQDALLARAILADLGNPPPSAPARAAAPVVVYQPPPPPATNGHAEDKPSDTGAVIADLYRALDELRLADALPIEARAPLAALVQILQLKNGTNI